MTTFTNLSSQPLLNDNVITSQLKALGCYVSCSGTLDTYHSNTDANQQKTHEKYYRKLIRFQGSIRIQE